MPDENHNKTISPENLGSPRHTPRGNGEPWTFRDVVADMLSPDTREYIEGIKRGTLVPFGKGESASSQDKTVMRDIERIAKNMGMEEAPVSFIDTKNSLPVPFAGAEVIAGRQAIIINDAALNKWTPQQLESVMAHEVKHLAAKDGSSSSFVSDLLSGNPNSAREEAADKAAVGPLGTCDPKSLSEALSIAMDVAYQNYKHTHPYVSKEQYISLNNQHDTDHTPIEKRLEYLKDLEKHPVPGCVKPLATPTGDKAMLRKGRE